LSSSESARLMTRMKELGPSSAVERKRSDPLPDDEDEPPRRTRAEDEEEEGTSTVRTQAPVTRFQTLSFLSLEREKASPRVSSWRWEERETISEGVEAEQEWGRRDVAGEATLEEEAEEEEEKEGRREVKEER